MPSATQSQDALEVLDALKQALTREERALTAGQVPVLETIVQEKRQLLQQLAHCSVRPQQKAQLEQGLLECRAHNLRNSQLLELRRNRRPPAASDGERSQYDARARMVSDIPRLGHLQA